MYIKSQNTHTGSEGANTERNYWPTDPRAYIQLETTVLKTQSGDENNSKYVISKYLLTLTSPTPFYLQTNTTLLPPIQHSQLLVWILWQKCGGEIWMIQNYIRG